MKKRIALILAVILVAALFLGCSKNDNSAVIGTWAWNYGDLGEAMRFTFREDGTGAMESFGESEEFTYTVTDGKIVLKIKNDKEAYDYRIEGNTMILTVNEEELTLTKK